MSIYNKTRVLNDLLSWLYRWEKKQQFLHILDFPRQVDIEPTNACNLSCIHCPLPDSKRKIGCMEEGLFRKIITELSYYHIDWMDMSVFGEPLLNPNFPGMLEFAKKYGNIKHIYFNTNGLLLDDEKAEGIVRSQVNKMIVSIDGATKKTYESIRVNGDFDTLVNNVKNFIKIREKMNSSKPALAVQIIKMQETVNEIGQFIKFWKPLIKNNDEINIKEHWTWGGAVPQRSLGKKNLWDIKVPCVTYLWSNLAIYWNGDVACCVDCDGHTIVGNVRKNTIKEIWTGEKLQNMRRLHLSGKIDTLIRCRNCEYAHREMQPFEIIRYIPRHIYQACRYIFSGKVK